MKWMALTRDVNATVRILDEDRVLKIVSQWINFWISSTSMKEAILWKQFSFESRCHVSQVDLKIWDIAMDTSDFWSFCNVFQIQEL